MPAYDLTDHPLAPLPFPQLAAYTPSDLPIWERNPHQLSRADGAAILGFSWSRVQPQVGNTYDTFDLLTTDRSDEDAFGERTRFDFAGDRVTPGTLVVYPPCSVLPYRAFPAFTEEELAAARIGGVIVHLASPGGRVPAGWVRVPEDEEFQPFDLFIWNMENSNVLLMSLPDTFVQWRRWGRTVSSFRLSFPSALGAFRHPHIGDTRGIRTFEEYSGPLTYLRTMLTHPWWPTVTPPEPERPRIILPKSVHSTPLPLP